MIEDEDRAADDVQPPAANDNGNGKATDRRGGTADRPVDRPADSAGRVRAAECRERQSAAGAMRRLTTEMTP